MQATTVEKKLIEKLLNPKLLITYGNSKVRRFSDLESASAFNWN